jgi:hypothetical protein
MNRAEPRRTPRWQFWKGATRQRQRAFTSETPAGFEIRVPVERSWWGIGFLPFWLTGWAIGWGVTFYGLITGGGGPPVAFAIPWLILWTGAGAMAFSWWIWLVSGREVVVIDGVRLRMRREVRGFARERTYELASVSNVRFSPPVTQEANAGAAFPLIAFSGSIAFDVEGETKRFGMGIEEPESKVIVDQIVERWPAVR